MKELNDKIIEWAKLRDLDKKGTLNSQRIKSVEEFAELMKGISKKDIAIIEDSIGDIYVTLIIGNMLKTEKIDMEKVLKEAKQEYKNVTYSLRLNIGSPEHAINQMQMATSCMRELLFIGYTRHSISLCLTYLIAVAEIYHLNLKECVESAYQEIKGRRGRIIDGTFVKESDLVDG